MRPTKADTIILVSKLLGVAAAIWLMARLTSDWMLWLEVVPAAYILYAFLRPHAPMNVCPRCGYDMAGLELDACPGCGHGFEDIFNKPRKSPGSARTESPIDNPSGNLFDPEAARALIGKYVLVGLTFLDRSENVTEQQQYHGTIVSADPEAIVVQPLGTDRKVSLPPDTSAFKPAQPGEFRIRATGETITNPDLLATWEIRPPGPAGEA
jgi:hypothetical protein